MSKQIIIRTASPEDQKSFMSRTSLLNRWQIDGCLSSSCFAKDKFTQVPSRARTHAPAIAPARYDWN